MQMPGFNAQGSLYRARGYYQGRSSGARNSPGGTIRPVLYSIDGLDCDWGDDGTLVCGDDSGGGVSFGGSKPSPKVTCINNCFKRYHAGRKRTACIDDCS
jgi:hypothetical protein